MDFNLNTGDLLPRFDSLYQYFSRKYHLDKIELMFGDHTVLLHYIKDVDQLLDELIALGPEDEAVKDEQLPYWAELWPSSVALSKFISSHSELIREKQILELGCGSGLTGILASLLGGEVTINDYLEDALKLAEMNWLLNVGKNPQSLLMDWRSPAGETVFDIILASDVVYEKRFFQPLIKIFEQNLVDEGKIILSEPNRTIAREFFALLDQHHFTHEKTDWEFEFKDRRHQISVYLISR